MWSIILTYLLCVSSINVVNAIRILGVFPYAGRSHFDVFEPVMKELTLKGHDVTVISHFPQKTPIRGYTDISFKDSSNFSASVIDFDGFLSGSRLIMIKGVAALGMDICDNLNHPNFDKLLDSNRKFDVMIIEFFVTDCFLALARHYKIPVIGFTSHILMPWTNDRVANIDNPAYIPNHFASLSDTMNFWERLENVVYYVGSKVVAHYVVETPANVAARAKFGQDLPPLSELAEEISLILTYTHFTNTRPRPLVPAIIEVGGLHLNKRQVKSLPKNIEKWINESEHGVIYFSMGSMIKGHTFPEEKRKIFLRAFGRLKQRVLWKWENDTMPGKPDNVMIQKWMPQFDILCHPNVKAFISHGGLLGTTEAVHCGVPVVVMPQFGDQHTNAKALEAGNGGVILNFRDADEEAVYKALKAVLDPEFNKKAKELSARFRDRPMSPMDTAIYWIEYVARHKGAHHMRTAAVGMPLYQYLLLDVFAFLALIVIVTFVVFFYTLKFFLCFLKSLFASPKKVKKN